MLVFDYIVWKKNTLRIRGEWDFILGVCLWMLKYTAKNLIRTCNWQCPQQLMECKNTEFVWELKRGFVKVAVSKAVRLQEGLFREVSLEICVYPVL